MADPFARGARQRALAYETERTRRVGANASVAFWILAGCTVGASIFDVVRFPDRLTAILALCAAIGVIIAASAIALRRAPGASVTVMIACVNALGFVLNAYHAMVGAQIAMCVWTLTGLLATPTVVLQWGWRAQLQASVGALIGFPILLSADPALALEWGAGAFYLAWVVALGAFGAALVDRALRHDFLLAELLLEREAQLQSYFDLSVVGIGILSLDLKWIEFNDALCRMLGYTRDELRRRSWLDLTPSTESPAESGLRRVAIGEVEALCRERPMVGKDGRPIHVILAARAIPRRGGDVERVMVVVQDITDRRRLEEDTRRAKEAAEAAARAKSEFLAGMSHEFRTPLHSIFGMIDLVLEGEVRGEQRAHLERARHGAESLLTLVNDVLDLSRIEAGKLTLRRRDFAVRPWLEATLEPLAFLAQQKGLELRSEVAAEVPDAVLGDPDRLTQVVVNLVANAIKFTDRGEVRVRVDTPTPGVAFADSLHIVVSDTGPGIPEDEQRAIFEPFMQAQGALDAATVGTGLGLAICSAIARLMAGRLWVESQVGAGSRFHFVARLTASE